MLISLFIIILLLFAVITYNKLVKQKNNVHASFSTVDVMLKKRHDLIPNLVASVKSMMKYEQELLEKVTSLRTQATGFNSISKERQEIENSLSDTLGKLQITMENYPDIKSDKNVLQLQAALNDVEEQISAARRIYNNAVKNYNNAIQTVPSNFVALAFNFQKENFFEVSTTERENVSVEKLINF